MPWRERLLPRRMARVAVVAPQTRWRPVIAAVADSGLLEPDPREGSEREIERPRTPPRIDASGPLSDEQAAARPDLAAGEAEIARVTLASEARDGVTALVGWAEAARMAELAGLVQPYGGTVVELATPPGAEPPTLLSGSDTSPVRPLVDTYATVPYRDVDPTWFAVGAYVLMFGMMFGDAGHGLLVVAGALWLRRTRRPWAAPGARVWPVIAAMGVSATFFGLLYGEFFGPTGVIPALWIEPLEEPVRLMVAAGGVGAALLAMSYLIGIVNRWREGGPGFAIYAPSGIAGLLLFLGIAMIAGGLWWQVTALWGLGAVSAIVALALVAIGRRAIAEEGAAGVVEAAVETFDVLVRLGSNIVSFARLAAFGLMHAALGAVVWDATTALWGPGIGALAAIVVFVVGNAVSFALEALIAAVQALRLEYYELFSRVFVTEGRPFRPWHVPYADKEAPS